MSRYEKSIVLNQFRGINQSLTLGDNLSLQYATYAENCDTRGGDLKPMRRGISIYEDSLPSPIATLARLHRRNYAVEDKRDVMVAVAGGKLYTRAARENTWTLRYTGIVNNDFDYVTYETNPDIMQDTIDILLLSNQDDGMLCLYGNDLHVEKVTTPYKFGVLGRHAERIWGAGIKDFPDLLVYSTPFNPFNWEQNNTIPEDGAGEVKHPSWDGDKFLGLRPYGSQLLAFQQNRIWRVLGTNPSNYIFKEQYGGGALVENSIVTVEDRIFMLGYSGLMYYDGVSVSPFRQEEIQELWARVNKEYIQGACGIVHDSRLYYALPFDDSEINNVVLIYDLLQRSFMLRTDTYVKSFLTYNDELYYCTDGAETGKVWHIDGGEALPLYWESGWQDMEAKNIVKSGYEVYLGVNAIENTEIDITIRTEKKPKMKKYIVRGNKVKRLRISNSGRRFRIEIASAANTMWYLRAGLQIQVELDED